MPGTQSLGGVGSRGIASHCLALPWDAMDCVALRWIVIGSEGNATEWHCVTVRRQCRGLCPCHCALRRECEAMAMPWDVGSIVGIAIASHCDGIGLDCDMAVGDCEGLRRDGNARDCAGSRGECEMGVWEPEGVPLALEGVPSDLLLADSTARTTIGTFYNPQWRQPLSELYDEFRVFPVEGGCRFWGKCECKRLFKRESTSLTFLM